MPAGQADWGGHTSIVSGLVVWHCVRSITVRLDKCGKRGNVNPADKRGGAVSTRGTGRNSSREFYSRS
eukprot:7976297-Pyramimonas_sp.AAC.1